MGALGAGGEAGREVNRRNFLKVISAVAVAAGVAPQTAIAEVFAPQPVGVVTLGLIREVFAYDIGRDETHVRHDVWAGGENLHLTVASVVIAGDQTSIERARWAAKTMLEAGLKRRGLSWSDLKPLPLPAGYKASDWTHG